MNRRELELDGMTDVGPCRCCGGISRTVWGFVHNANGTEAGYLVRWTLGTAVKRGAHFDLIIGKWGEEVEANHRVAVSLKFRRNGAGPRFTFINANHRPAGRSDLVGKALTPVEIIGTAMADTALALVDHICLNDPRIVEIKKSAEFVRPNSR